MLSTKHLIRRIQSRVRSQLGISPPWESRTVLGNRLVLREGTCSDEPDYDDAWLVACTRHASSMFDVGSNVGVSSLFALMSPSMRQVVLVEANADALAVAAQNLIKNHLSARARLVGAFASDKADQEVELWTVGTGAAGSMYPGHAITAARVGQSRRVPTVTLDDLSRQYSFVPEFVKIDVEGAEAQVLRGSSTFASKHVSRFLVEMHSPPELPMVRNTELVLDWTKSVKYAAWYLSEGTRLESPAAVQHRGRCHLLLQPADWPFPEWLNGITQSAPLPTSS